MFGGFTDRTLDFLIAIRFNNNRAFFHENHDWYMESVRKPLLELAFDLAGTIEQIDPELERRPERVVSRINRDLRFSKDKSPYRDYMWIGWHNPANKGGLPGYYVDISPDHLGYGLGFWEDNKPLIEAHKLYLINHPDDFLRTVPPALEGMGLELRGYKRTKFPDELKSELQPWYAMRSLFVFRNIGDYKEMFDANLGETIRQAFLKLAPVYRYFAGLKPAE